MLTRPLVAVLVVVLSMFAAAKPIVQQNKGTTPAQLRKAALLSQARDRYFEGKGNHLSSQAVELSSLPVLVPDTFTFDKKTGMFIPKAPVAPVQQERVVPLGAVEPEAHERNPPGHAPGMPHVAAIPAVEFNVPVPVASKDPSLHAPKTDSARVFGGMPGRKFPGFIVQNPNAWVNNEEHVTLDYPAIMGNSKNAEQIKVVLENVGRGKKIGVMGVEGLAPTVIQLALAFNTEVIVFAPTTKNEARIMKLGATAFVPTNVNAFNTPYLRSLDLIVYIEDPADNVGPPLDQLTRTLNTGGHFVEIKSPV